MSPGPRAIALVGCMGAGKTTVGGLLAAALGIEFRDTDTLVELETGRSIPALFDERGEAGFRAVEERVVLAALAAGGAVVALGGGAVASDAVRVALAGCDIVWLDLPLAEASRRIGSGADRPLAGELAARHERRAVWYAEVATVRVDAAPAPAEVVGAILAALGLKSPLTSVDAGGYPVHTGTGVLPGVAGMVPAAARKAAVITGDTPILRGYADRVRRALAARGLAVTSLPVPDGEAAKTPAVAVELWRALAEAGLTRSDVVVSVGGGSVTDLAGFVAATWLRGIAVVHVPTTLLAMVDAAVGGKTAIDLVAKNSVGAFHNPSGVLAELRTLATLPIADLRAGLAEVIKVGFVADPTILDMIMADPGAAQDPSSPVFTGLVEKAISVKARVVRADPRENSLREILNYGHTVGHAIESVEHYGIRHGEAVALGMIFAAELAHLARGLPAQIVARHRAVLAAVGLPTRYVSRHPATPDFATAIRPVLASDKKARGRSLRFVVLDAVGAPARLVDPRVEHLVAAYRRLVD